MTDQQLNERLLCAIGFDRLAGIGGEVSGIMIDGYTFSPATSVDALRKWVLPEIERRVMWEVYCEELARICPEDLDGQIALVRWLMFEGEPSVLAAAALECMEASNG